LGSFEFNKEFTMIDTILQTLISIIFIAGVALAYTCGKDDNCNISGHK